MMMTITSRSTSLTQTIRQHIRSRLSAALNQHKDRVRHISVTLEDVNGPRGGKDQSCRVAVELTDGTTLHHQRVGFDLYANISLIADKVKRRVGTQIAKLKKKRA